MSLDFTGLTDLAKAPETKTGWQPLTVDDLGYGTALCFDQSLSATGALLVSHVYPGSAPSVSQVQTWNKGHEGRGVEDWLVQGVDVYERANRLVAPLVGRVDAFVHESPPNPGAVKKGNSVSSLLSALALRCAGAAHGVSFEMLGAQPAKKLVCGNSNAGKTEAHKALKETVLPWVVNSSTITNEAQRDALMVGLLWLARRKQ